MRELDTREYRIPLETHNRCLVQAPEAKGRGGLHPIIDGFTDPPEWLNDYFVAAALETLSREGRIVKAEQYDASVWPTRAISYVFLSPRTDEPVEASVERIQTDSMCRVHQGFSFLGDSNRCRLPSRFDVEHTRRTVSYNTTSYEAKSRLKESAPPCERCWERREAESSMYMLAARLIENELRQYLISSSLDQVLDEPGRFYEDGLHGPVMEVIVSAWRDGGVDVDDVDAALQVARNVITSENGVVHPS